MTREEAIKIFQRMKIILSIPNSDAVRMIEAIDMAIEALSAEAVQGVGRYENAMQKLREMPRYLNGVKTKQIKKIPSETVQRWIPVSYRLPSDGRRCLVFYDGSNIGPSIDIMRYAEPTMPNVDVSGKHFYKSDSEWGDIVYDEVVAWMPLPEPYKGGDAEILNEDFRPKYMQQCPTDGADLHEDGEDDGTNAD